MLTVVDRHKVHTSVVTFIEDQLSVTYRATWCRCLLFLWYMEIVVEDFPSHRHHLRVSFVNNTILDINYGAVCRCRRSAYNSQTLMSFYVVRIWRWNITFDPQASIENIGNCVDNRNFVRKKNTFSFFHPKQCKAVRSGCRILYKWQSAGSITILRCLPLSFSSTILDKTVDTNPLSPGQCWFGVACWAHCHLNFSVEYGKRLSQHCSGGRGATDTLFHNKGDLFRKFGGKVPFLSMCQQVLSKIVSQSFSIFSWSTDPNGTNS